MFDMITNIIITAPEEDLQYCEAMIKQYFDTPDKPYLLIPGGAERQDSVFNALQHCAEDTDMVAIHDGVRPFINTDLICSLIEACTQDQAVIPAAKLKHTIKETEGIYAVKTLPRSQLIQVFTPQVFDYHLILDAYLRAYDDGFIGTDDASLLERIGFPVRYLLTSELNIKITDELDLFFATQIINKNMIDL